MTREYISTTPISERSDRVQHKIYHHLDCLRRGKMTRWLKNRMAWDAEVCSAVAEVLMPALKPSFDDAMKAYFQAAIQTQFNKPSVLARITGLSVP